MDNSRVPIRERQHSRMRAVQCIYGCDMLGTWTREEITLFFGVADRNMFGRDLAIGVLEKREAIDKLLSDACSNGDLLKTALVERAILRVAAYELLINSEPVPVIINEALIVTKRLTSQHSVAFINAVLDKFAESLQSQTAKLS